MLPSTKREIRRNMEREIRAESNFTRNPIVPVDKRVIRATNQLKTLRSEPWNGFSELTDEAEFGHVLFEVRGPKLNITFNGRFKTKTRSREMHVLVHQDITNAQICVLRENQNPTVVSSILQVLQDEEIDRYYNESILLANLISKMQSSRSVRDHWLPTFAPSLTRIDNVLNSKTMFNKWIQVFPKSRGMDDLPETLGQWFLFMIITRMQSRITKGINLRILFYAVSWLVRLFEENDELNMRGSAVAIEAWIVSNTCADCLLKTLMHTRRDLTAQHFIPDNDTFSQFFKVETISITVNFGQCGKNTGISQSTSSIRNDALRTIGEHSFLVSSFAMSTTDVEIKIRPDARPERYRMTLRQLCSLRTVIDLHARILRAYGWRVEAGVFESWLKERRIDPKDRNSDIHLIIIPDLKHIARLNSTLHTMVSHLIILIITGKLSPSIINASYSQRTLDEDHHSFVIRHVFNSALDPDSIALTEKLLSDASCSSLLPFRHHTDDQPPRAIKRLKLTDADSDIFTKWNLTNLPDADREADSSSDILSLHDDNYLTELCDKIGNMEPQHLSTPKATQDEDVLSIMSDNDDFLGEEGAWTREVDAALGAISTHPEVHVNEDEAI